MNEGKKIVVRYKLKADRVKENEQLVRAVYRQLHERKPEGIRYATYKLADGLSFLHIAQYETEEARKALTNLPAFGEFQAHIKDRCEELPIAGEAEEIGAY
jgi:hypothetical protein